MIWKTIRRETSLVEHVCQHSIGHPNSYSVARLNKFDNEDAVAWGQEITPLEASHWWAHGCDGCCHLSNFPGRRMSDAELWLRLSDKFCDYRHGDLEMSEMRDWFIFTAHDMNINYEMGWEE